MMVWRVPKIWKGADVWIIGGGPSICEQFEIPKDIITEAKETNNLTLLGSRMSYLRDKHVIGVNAAFLLGDFIDWVFFGDNEFVLQNIQALHKFSGLCISCASNTTKYDWIKVLLRNGRKQRGISSEIHTVSWNFNSGAAAINLAVHTGAKRIFLLGFDMLPNEDSETHWHMHYGNKKTTQTTFNRHLKGFDQIAIDAKKLGVEIINVNPKSRISQFPKKSIKEVINE